MGFGKIFIFAFRRQGHPCEILMNGQTVFAIVVCRVYKMKIKIENEVLSVTLLLE